MPEPSVDGLQLICTSRDLQDGGLAVPFDVVYAGQSTRAFAVRFEGQPQAYLNRCTHVAMELDWQPNRVFDTEGKWLLCATHGATYAPQTGQCVGGPCRGALVKIDVVEEHGRVLWQTAYNLKPQAF